MISNKIIKTLLKGITEKQKDNFIKEVMNHIVCEYLYTDDKYNSALELLVDDRPIIRQEDISLDYIRTNLDILIYNSSKYDIKNIAIDIVDNIGDAVRVTYDYCTRSNAEDEHCYHHGAAVLSYIDYPKLLK